MNLLPAYRIFTRLWSRAFTWSVRAGFASFGHGSVLSPPVRLGGTRAIAVGKNSFFGPGCWLLSLSGAPPDPSVHAPPPVIRIGDNVRLSGYCTITGSTEVTIEDSVLIARYVYISDHSHKFTDTQTPIMDQGITAPKPVRIGRGSWLGQSAVICPGVTIGRNCVVGANSVVREDVPDFCVAAGVPARVVRRIADPSTPPRGD